MKNLLVSIILVAFSFCMQTVHAQSFTCLADESWITSPSLPTEVATSNANGTSNFCDFYQFSWQSFAYLTSPSSSGDLRHYQVVDNYPILEPSPANSCDETSSSNVFFVRTTKPVSASTPFTIPERIGQAGGGATIYDQNGNAVYYEIRFSRNMCSPKSIQKSANFPPGTTEIKTAWRIVSPQEAPKYFTITASIDGISGQQTLGLVGFHQAIATKNHPEFVWATFEHMDNTPDCRNPQPAPKTGWSFSSASCAASLNSHDVESQQACNFNQAQPFKQQAKSGQSLITGTASEICRINPYGTNPGDSNATENLGAIRTINASMVGQNGFLTTLPNANPMSVFQNYFIVGALWVSDASKPSNISNQRGSLRLANTVAETTFQNVNLNPTSNNGFMSNCFGCHSYNTTQGNTSSDGSLSHIFDDVVKGIPQQCVTYNAGPIKNVSDAQTTCPAVCGKKKTHNQWKGQWTTVVPDQMSVCFCCE